MKIRSGVPASAQRAGGQLRTLANFDKLYSRALAIQSGRANGLWEPIIWHLALRGYPPALVVLADWMTDSGPSLMLLRPGSHLFSAGNLYRRAWRDGDVLAAYNYALAYFNANNLGRYRVWLRRAAQTGDQSALQQLRAFDTRLPHRLARKIGRHRPRRIGADYW